jgi:hypothetical protein
LLPSFQPKCRELHESADVAAGVEPLEEAPEEADPEVLEEAPDLLPVVKVKLLNQLRSFIHFQKRLRNPVSSAYITGIKERTFLQLNEKRRTYFAFLSP